MKKKTLTVAIALVLVVALAVGATYAYLTAETEAVTNTFTAGGAVAQTDFSLWEHRVKQNDDGSYVLDNNTPTATGNSYTVLPGVNLPKDPTVTISKSTGSYYLFVTVEKGSGFTAVGGSAAPLSYTVASSWEGMNISGDGAANKELYVYTVTTEGSKTYIQPASNIATNYAVLAGIVGDTSNTIKVSDSSAALNLGENGSELKFVAYACQSAGFANPVAAWNGAFAKSTNITATEATGA